MYTREPPKSRLDRCFGVITFRTRMRSAWTVTSPRRHWSGARAWLSPRLPHDLGQLLADRRSTRHLLESKPANGTNPLICGTQLTRALRQSIFPAEVGNWRVEIEQNGNTSRRALGGRSRRFLGGGRISDCRVFCASCRRPWNSSSGTSLHIRGLIHRHYRCLGLGDSSLWSLPKARLCTACTRISRN
jgi:hypothetical protein